MSRIDECYDTEKAKLLQIWKIQFLSRSLEWKLNSHALTVMRTDERHMADVCASHFMDVGGQWNIEEKHSTLSQCLYRTLHLTVHLLNVRKVVGHFKHSPPNTAELKTQQVAHGLKAEALVQDVPTRWNSTLEMIKRVQRNQEALRDVLAQKKNNVTMPTKSELEKLQKLEILLEPCRYFTELRGGEKFVSCSVVLPALCHLSRVMESSEDDPAYIVKFKQTFSADMTRKDKTNLTWLKISTATNLRFKDLKCLHRSQRAEVWALIAGLLKEEMHG
ncbi:Zinc finger BED domain-containing protein 1 [Merluccius polli]|uniref:Zinc finger BED domain-containing protein 1 n=1 Tax=Merluccius polli TaxID=89951 RepID=A0AA47M8G0_MERPO|nr:Zinc finger BED domain-containing protein 1 [Merluccius polli]